jgi:thiol-disulfide isomerase/thioredoxin
MSFRQIFRSGPTAALLVAMAAALCQLALPQGSAPLEKSKAVPAQQAVASLLKVKQIDIKGLKPLLKPNGKPLLVNFWATWCDPCREEFPDLVKISAEFQGKVDFVTVSLDELSDINTYVPKFLQEMNSTIPAYLLHTPDEAEELGMIFKDWKGNLPLTVIYDTVGGIVYFRNGKIRYETVKAEINKLLTPTTAPKSESVGIQARPIELLPSPPRTFAEGIADAQRDIAIGEFKIVRYGMAGVAPSAEYDRLLKKYSVTITGTVCFMP